MDAEQRMGARVHPSSIPLHPILLMYIRLPTNSTRQKVRTKLNESSIPLKRRHPTYTINSFLLPIGSNVRPRQRGCPPLYECEQLVLSNATKVESWVQFPIGYLDP